METGNTVETLDTQAIIAAFPGPVLILNRDFQVVAANRRYEEAVSASPGSLVGRSIFALFPEAADADGHPGIPGPRNLRAALERVLRLGVPDTLPCQRLGGRNRAARDQGALQRACSLITAPIFGPEGGVSHLLHRIEEITDFDPARGMPSLEGCKCEPQRSEGDGREERRLRHRLLAGIGKEFRAPLNALMAILEGVGVTRPDKPLRDGARRRQAAVAQTLALVRLVDRLQDLLLLDAEKADADFRLEDLPAITSALAKAFHFHVGRRDIEFALDCPPLRNRVSVDREMWEKILIKLLAHAFQAASGGRIRLRLRDAGAAVELDVSHTGEGIPEAVPAWMKDGPGEAGLGLALVKRLVWIHGGEVRTASGPGKGTQVTVRLPWEAARKEDAGNAPNASVDARLRPAGLRRQAEEGRFGGNRKIAEGDKMAMVGRLAAGLAHDFNNLLTVVNGYADLALGMAPDMDLRGCLLEIQEAGTRAAEVVKLLLAYGRKQVSHPRPLQLNELVLEMQPTLSKLFPESTRLVVRLDPDLAPVLADRAQMAQVILNLALNAKEAMPEAGIFTLETANARFVGVAAEGPGPGNAGGCARLILKDTGIGIDPDEIDRIFDPYFTSKPLGPVKGKGLGLSSVQGIIRQHHGQIRARSRPGEGTTFEILLPAAEQHPSI